MSQLLLFPDPRPLVERLGCDFFRRLPETPGVYLMRDCSEAVLYVGKAKNLRKRLSSYRVANPDRMRRRHLRLLRAVNRIELQPCADEAAALARESELLRTLRPKFNRAGTWPGTPRFLTWRTADQGLELAVTLKPGQEWHSYGPLGMVAVHLRAALARLIWSAVHAEKGTAGLPDGWFGGRLDPVCVIPFTDGAGVTASEAAEHLESFFNNGSARLAEWILAGTASWTHRFNLVARDTDLEILTQFAQHTLNRAG